MNIVGMKMERLMVIADDFTGALDTGVQFAQHGAITKVMTTARSMDSSLNSEIQVIVVNSETRHLSPEDAYKTVYRIASAGLRAGVGYFYKKTDSGLRGNIGAELSAVMDAVHADNLQFFPSFPKMNRTTVNGILNIDGLPVAESVFGKDLFEPVTKSSVKEIILSQTDKPVYEHTDVSTADSREGIHVFDSRSDADLSDGGASLGKKGLYLSAGCAGFAPVLAGILGLHGSPLPVPKLEAKLMVVCGSLNPVTVQQVTEAEQSGMHRLTLSAEQKVNPECFANDCGRLAEECMEVLRQSGCCIVDVGDSDCSSAAQYVQKHNLTVHDLRMNIATSLGAMARSVFDLGFDSTMMCIGGDTLQAIVEALGIFEITPICEIMQGVPLSVINYKGKEYHLLTKSGGFGNPDLLRRLFAMMSSRRSA